MGQILREGLLQEAALAHISRPVSGLIPHCAPRWGSPSPQPTPYPTQLVQHALQDGLL